MSSQDCSAFILLQSSADSERFKLQKANNVAKWTFLLMAFVSLMLSCLLLFPIRVVMQRQIRQKCHFVWIGFLSLMSIYLFEACLDHGNTNSQIWILLHDGQFFRVVQTHSLMQSAKSLNMLVKLVLSGKLSGSCPFCDIHLCSFVLTETMSSQNIRVIQCLSYLWQYRVCVCNCHCSWLILHYVPNLFAALIGSNALGLVQKTESEKTCTFETRMFPFGSRVTGDTICQAFA